MRCDQREQLYQKCLHMLLEDALHQPEIVEPAPTPAAPEPGPYPAHWQMFSAREQDILRVLEDGQTRPAKQIASLAHYEHSDSLNSCLTNLVEREVLISNNRGYALNR